MSMDYRTQLALTVIHQHSERLRLSATFTRPDRSD